MTIAILSVRGWPRRVGVPARRINETVHGKRAITADTALRLARFFGTSAEFWLNLQAHYDLEVHRDEVGPRIKREVEVFHQKVA